ncbi:hypothetical protein B0H21DRAFT_826508 [Amylocystis lapponica]|nr:hypothetical protein B0H21DRAFT_826508 [Amylocystis lapponica]
MHRALRCPDILYEIFDHLDLVPEQLSGRPTIWPSLRYTVISRATKQSAFHPNRVVLANAACSCKAFSSPALNLLWKRLDSFQPLLQLFSCFQPIPPESAVDWPLRRRTCLYMSADPAPGEWTRFQQYAQYVQSIAFTTSEAIDLSVFSWLLRHNKDQPPLPALQNMIWDGALKINVYNAHRSDIPRPVQDIVNGHFLADVMAASPALQELTIHTINATVPAGPMTTGNICRHLRKLDLIGCDGLDGLSLCVLSNLDDLRDLAITLPATAAPEVEGKSAFALLTGGFHNVQQLCVNGTAQQLLSFLGVVAPRLLRVLKIRDLSPSLNVPLRRGVLETVASRYPTLRHMTCNFRGAPGDETALGALMDTLQPLLTLSRLEELVMKLGSGVPLAWTARDVRAMAYAWPRITVLWLDYEVHHGGHAPAPVPPVHALVDLARHCPRLRELCLPAMNIDADTLLYRPTLPVLRGMRHLRLRCRDCETTEAISMQYDVAKFIDRMFPALEDLDKEILEHDSSMCPCEEWLRILVLLSAWNKARTRKVNGVLYVENAGYESL